MAKATSMDTHLTTPEALPLDENAFGLRWWLAVIISAAFVIALFAALFYTALTGIGVWGNNIPFVWGFDLANYGWWIGMANGSALFACLLILWRAPMRLAISRWAEALALAAAICAALFPVFHLGKAWLSYWMVPYPAHTGLWPQPMSPLTWDFWSIFAYLLTIASLWYIGLIPDLAMLRDRARARLKQRIYGLFALGWTGSSRQWALQQHCHRLLALSVIPFLIVMQSIVALELAVTLVPDWHDTGLPVRFVVSGFASGLALVYFFAGLMQSILPEMIDVDDDLLDQIGVFTLGAVYLSMFVVGLTALLEWLAPPDSSNSLTEWTSGSGAVLTWSSLFLSKVVPQLLWFRKIRRNRYAAIGISAAIASGIWLDHLSTIILGLAHGHMETAGNLYAPSIIELIILIGTLALCLLIMLIFARLLPLIAIYAANEKQIYNQGERLP